MVFQLISRRYERGSVILTSNKAFSEWGTVFADDVLATVFADDVLAATTAGTSGCRTRIAAHAPSSAATIGALIGPDTPGPR
jgi:hypothetical protein